MDLIIRACYMRSLIKNQFSMSLFVALLQANMACAESPKQEAHLATQRIVNGITATTRAIEFGSDLYKAREKVKNSASSKEMKSVISVAKAKYNKTLADNGFQMKAYEGFQLVRDGGLTLAGPVGIALAGTFRATLDRFVVTHYEAQNEAASTLMHVAIRKMSSEEFERFKKNPGDRRDEIKKIASDMLHSENLPEKDRDLLANNVTEMGLNLGIETYNNLFNIKTDIEELERSAKTSNSMISEIYRSNVEMHNKSQIAINNIQIGVTEVRFSQMSDEEKQQFLKAGGMDHLSPEDKDRLTKDVNYKVGVNSVVRGFEYASTTMSGLSNLSRNIFKNEEAAQMFDEVNKTVQVAQFAFSAFMAFSPGGAGFMAGMQSINSLSTIFGGNNGPMAQLAPHLEKIQKQLSLINEKLDKVIELQQQTLDEIRMVSSNIKDIQESLNELKHQIEEGNNIVLQGIWQNYFGGCSDLVQRKEFLIKFPNGDFGPAVFGTLNSQQWQSFHFVNIPRLEIYNNDIAKKCYKGMEDIVNIASNFGFFITDDDLDTRSQTLAFQNQRFLDLVSRIRNVASIHGINDTSINLKKVNFLEFMAVFSRPLISIHDAIDYWNPKNISLIDVSLTCWWESKFTDKCKKWDTLFNENDRSNPLLTRLIYPGEVLRYADFVLSFYPIPILPSPPRDSEFNEKWMEEQLRINSDKENTRRMIRLLEKAIRLVDISIIQQTILNGAPLLDSLSETILNPIAGASVNEKHCSGVKIDASNPNDPFLNVELKLFFKEHPDIARAAIMAALFKRAFHSEIVRQDESQATYTTLTENAVEYMSRIIGAPLDWNREGKVMKQDENERKLANEWWKTFTSTKIADAKDASNALQFVYIKQENEKIPFSTVTRRKLDDGDSLRDGECLDSSKQFALRALEDEIPISDPGWYVLIGNVITPVIPVADLFKGPLAITPTLQQLLSKRNDLVAERWSFETDIDQQIRDLFVYEIQSIAHKSKQEFFHGF